MSLLSSSPPGSLLDSPRPSPPHLVSSSLWSLIFPTFLFFPPNVLRPRSLTHWTSIPPCFLFSSCMTWTSCRHTCRRVPLRTGREPTQHLKTKHKRLFRCFGFCLFFFSNGKLCKADKSPAQEGKACCEVVGLTLVSPHVCPTLFPNLLIDYFIFWSYCQSQPWRESISWPDDLRKFTFEFLSNHLVIVIGSLSLLLHRSFFSLYCLDFTAHFVSENCAQIVSWAENLVSWVECIVTSQLR